MNNILKRRQPKGKTLLSRTAKSGIWYTFSSFFVRALGFITTPIFTRLLTQTEYGDYSNYTAWLNILVILVTLHLEASLISAKHDYEDFDNYAYSVLTLSTLSVVVWGIVLNVFYSFVNGFTDLDRMQLNCMLVYMLFYPAINMFLSRERYLYRYVSNVIISIGYALATSALSVILVVGMTNGLQGRILGQVIPTVGVGLGLYIYLFIKGKKKINFSSWKYALPLVLPYIPHLLSMTVLGSTDRIMIRSICGSEDAALYSLAYTCGTIVSLLITALNNAFAPWLSDKINAGDTKSVHRISYFYIGGFSVAAVGLMLITPEVLYIMGGSSYMAALYVMPPVTMGCVCQFLYTMFVNVEQIKKKTGWMALASAAAAVINIILNLIFIPIFGYMAAAFTTLVGYLCLLLMHMLIVYRIKMSYVYNYKFVWIVAGIMCVLSFLIALLYENTLLRWCIIAALVIAGVIFLIRYRDKLSALISSRRK